MLNISVDKYVSNLYALSLLAKKKYGDNCYGCSSSVNPDKAFIHLVDGQNPAQALELLNAFSDPTCQASGLNVTVNLGTLIQNDVTTVSPHASLQKSIWFALLIDDVTGDPEVYAFEKTDGDYGDIPNGKTILSYLKEYTIPANGTVLTEVV